MIENKILIFVLVSTFSCVLLYTNSMYNNHDLAETNLNRKAPPDFKLKSFYNDEVLCERSQKEHKKFVQIVDNYVQRYISLFLITSNLLDYEVKEKSESITADLEISLSGEDLMYLQQHSKRLMDSDYTGNLSKLDEILSNIARKKQKTFLDNSVKSWEKVFSYFHFSIPVGDGFNNLLAYGVIIIVTLCVYYFCDRKSFLTYVSILLNCMIIWEGLMMYKRRLKEADIRIRLKSKVLSEIPESCFPQNLKWYHRVSDYLFGDECLKYYETVNATAEDEVFLLMCIVDAYSLYLVQTPGKAFGVFLRVFTGEITSILPWPFQAFVTLGMAPLFLVLFLVFLLVLFGTRLRLSFFGAAIDIDGKKSFGGEEERRVPVTGSQRPKAIGERRKLRPWTKSRFPRRLDSDFFARRRLLWKPSRVISRDSSQSELAEAPSVSYSLPQEEINKKSE